MRSLADYDLIIVGGGINGTAICRDAAMRGLTTLLLEAKDFASGASGHNGRMIHGGLRYLEHGDIGLVMEALRERHTLLKIAPHLVRKSSLIIPVLRDAGRPSWQLRLGLLTLDLMDFGRFPRHKWLDKNTVAASVPGIHEENLKGAFVMSDAYCANAERLTIENAVSSSEAGADVRNYTPVTAIARTEAGALEVHWQENKTNHRATARMVINSTGAWVDEFMLKATGKKTALVTKATGSFLVLKAAGIVLHDALFIESREDGRPVLVAPWQGNLLVGTTDRKVECSVEDTETTDREIEYLLDAIERAFKPGVIQRSDVLYAYNGVRPLPVSDGPSHKVTRKHVIHRHKAPLDRLISVYGGKLSTFRALAEDVTDAVFRTLERPVPRCTTAKELLPGGASEALDFDLSSQFSDQSVDRLNGLFGTRATRVIALAKNKPELAENLDDRTGATAAEWVYAVRHEHAQSLSDIFLRRTLLGYGPDRGKKLIASFKTIARKHLRWDEQKIASDLEEYLGYIASQSCTEPDNMAGRG